MVSWKVGRREKSGRPLMNYLVCLSVSLWFEHQWHSTVASLNCPTPHESQETHGRFPWETHTEGFVFQKKGTEIKTKTCPYWNAWDTT